ncbi:hypothetical protein MYX04_12255 [Nitrospiraceae bacterium AH_259_D15_M11_P09]|nr:hypothetical protein [Nitrospiraceae bacterium AH_259_D15_M11_P09]
MGLSDSEFQALRSQIEPLITGAVRLLANIAGASGQNRDKAMQEYGRLLDAHMLATGVISSVLTRTNLVPGATSPSISERLALVASFVQGIAVCESTISEGLYAQASALLKQELETLAAIQECQKGKRKPEKTPNVGSALWNMNQTYGDLNRLAHVADSQLLNKLYQCGGPAGFHETAVKLMPVSIQPQYHRDVARNLYAVRVIFLVLLGMELGTLTSEMYGDGLNENEKTALFVSAQHVANEGYLEKQEQI